MATGGLLSVFVALKNSKKAKRFSAKQQAATASQQRQVSLCRGGYFLLPNRE
jgi:hypothetical protein